MVGICFLFANALKYQTANGYKKKKPVLYSNPPLPQVLAGVLCTRMQSAH